MSYERYHEIFRRSSKTFYWASRFFPKRVRDEVAVLYAFVRIVDDMIDSREPMVDRFYENWRLLDLALDGYRTGVWYIDSFADLAIRRGFSREHVEAFMRSMEMDLYRSVYPTIEDLLEYIYGSAEVIGAFMSRIMGLPGEAEESAMRLGRAYQFINMVRDIGEDLELGRIYMPLEDLERFGVKCICDTPEFREMVRFEVERFYGFLEEAEKGYRYLPKRYLVAIKTSSDLYRWAAKRIYMNPGIVLRDKVRPGILRSLSYGIANLVVVW